MKQNFSNHARAATLLGVALVSLMAGCAPPPPAAKSVPASAATAAPSVAEPTVLSVISEEISPESQAFYKKVATDFEAAHPNVKINFEFPDKADALATRIAAGQPPDITTMQLEAMLFYADKGMLEPAQWWLDKHGSDVVENASVPYKGVYYAIPYALTSEMWWYRKDVFEKAGLKKPETQADMLAAAKALNDPAKGFYGIAIAAGPSEWTAWHYEIFLWQNGGFVFDTNLKPSVDSKESLAALNYLKELYQYSPPDSTTWEWFDSITAFAAEKVAMSQYGGRLLVHVNRDNPSLAPKTAIMDQPMGVIRAGPLSRKSLVIMKDSKNKELAKEFIEFMFKPENLLPFLRTVPIHLTPPLKSLRESPLYMDDPLIQSHLEDAKIAFAAAAYGRSLGWESANHPPNPYAGALNDSSILVKMIQRVLLNNEKPEDATAWAKGEILKLQAKVDAERAK